MLSWQVCYWLSQSDPESFSNTVHMLGNACIKLLAWLLFLSIFVSGVAKYEGSCMYMYVFHKR